MPRIPAGRPWISANFVMTWDGRITTRRRTPSDFSSASDKRRLLEIRALADAVVVSAVTARVDGMTMGLPDADLRAARTARGQAPFPLRVLLSNTGRIDPALPLFAKRTSPVLIFSTERMPKQTRLALARRAELRLDSAAHVDLRAMVSTLRREFAVRRLHCEGGGTLLRSLVEIDLLDELFLTLAPRIFGSTSAPGLTGPPGDFLGKTARWKLLEMEAVGGECFLRYRILRPRRA